MRAVWRTLTVGVCLAAVAAAQPKVNAGGVVNAGGYTFLGQPGIAQGAIIVIFGTGLGPPNITYAPPAFPLPTTVPEGSGTSVRITPASGPELNAPVIYTLATQVAAILPSATPPGKANLRVSYNGQTSDPEEILVVERNFAIFTWNQGGYGPAAVQNYVPPAPGTYPPNTLVNAAAPGQTVVLYGTGLGPIAGDDANAQPVANLTSDVEVIVGGRSIRPDYAGRTPCCAGEDQINFNLPEDAPEGCFVPLLVRVAGRDSNQGSLSIGRGRVCQDAFGLSEGVLTRLAEGGSVTFGSLSLSAFDSRFSFGGQNFETKSEDASGQFVQYNAGVLALFGSFAVPSLTIKSGACTSYSYTYKYDPEDPDGPPAPWWFSILDRIKPLDAGPKLVLSGAGKTWDMMQDPEGLDYFAQLYQSTTGLPPTGQPSLAAGRWTIQGPGGQDVGAFTANLDLPQPLGWTQDIQEVNRSQPLGLVWTGGGANDLVEITGSSSAPVSGVADTWTTGGFTCIARASAGAFSVPADVLSKLPATPGDTPGSGNLSLYLVSPTEASRFTAPLTAGGEIDLGIFSYSFGHMRSVTYQ